MRVGIERGRNAGEDEDFGDLVRVVVVMDVVVVVVVRRERVPFSLPGVDFW